MSVRSPFEELLADCSPRVDVAGKPKGTAFYVAPGWAVTAAHVVTYSGVTVDLVSGSRTRTGLVRRVWPRNVSGSDPHPLPDLALIEVDEGDHPCVRLASADPNVHTTFMTYGYTRTFDHATVRPEWTTNLVYTGSLDDPDLTGTRLYKVTAGEIVGGMSGGPVVDVGGSTGPGNGLVVGMTRTTRGQGDLGGWVVRWHEIRELLGEDVVAAHDAYHAVDQRWARAWTASTDRFSTVLAKDDPNWWPGRSIVPFTERQTWRDERNRFLAAEHLGYLPLPVPEFTPQALLERLSQTSSGVLLVAAAGAGKTRLCVEVAHLAVRHGWPVWLTRSPGPPGAGDRMLTIDDLRRAVFGPQARATGRVLVILDYLDSYHQQLPLAELRWLLSEAETAGIRLMLLATCRPGAENELRGREAGSVLEIERLPTPRRHRRELADHILRQVAPRAVAEWGLDHVRAQCVSREAPPLFTLLLAVALERGHDRGRTASEPLFAWLQRRMIADRIVPAGVRPAPGSELTSADIAAYALAAATCRRRRSGLAATIGEATARLGATHEDDHIDRLEETGWLVTGDTVSLDPEYDILHDSVADVLLTALLFPRQTNTPDQVATLAALDAVATDPLALARFCVQFARVYDGLDNPQRRRNLRRICAGWLAERAPALGERLTGWGPDGQPALYALLHHRPWSSGAPWQDGTQPQADESLVDAHLDTLVGPLPEAGVIGEMLRTTPDSRPVHAACIWLANNRGHRSVPHVLINLMRRQLDPGELADRSCRYAMSWLREHAHDPSYPALVSVCLLNRQMAVSEHAPELVARAAHLAASLTAPFTNDLYSAWLEHEAIVRRHTEAVADGALGSAAAHPLAVSVGGLLHRLLGTPSAARLWDRILPVALAWLDRHSRVSSTPFLLRSLLARYDHPSARTGADEVVDHALTWLVRTIDDSGAPYVLQRLLAVRGLSADKRRRAVDQTIRWAARKGRSDGPPAFAQHAYRLLPMVMRLVRPDPAEARRVGADVFALLVRRRSPWTVSHAYLLHSLLLGRLGTAQDARTIALARSWLDEHAETKQASWVYQGLFRNPHVPAVDYATLVTGADRWLNLHGESPGAGYLVTAALGQRSLSDDQRQTMRGHAEALVAAGAGQRNTLVQLDAQVVAGLATPQPVAGGPRPDLNADNHDLVTWIERHPTEYGVGYAVIRLCNRQPSPAQIRRVIPVAEQWLARHADSFVTPVVLRLLVTHTGRTLKRSENVALIATATAWVRDHPTGVRTGSLLAALLWRNVLGDADRADLLALARSWLERHPDLQDSAYVLAVLLQHQPSAADHQRLLDMALDWVGSRADEVASGLLIQAVMKGGGVSEHHRASLIEPILTWLDAHGRRGQSALWLMARWGTWLRNLRITRSQADRFALHARAAIERLDRPGLDRKTAYQLNGCMDSALAADVIDPVIVQPLIVRAISWLDRGDAPQHTSYRLCTLLAHRHLTPGQTRHVLDLALSWLSGKELESKDNGLIQGLLRFRALSQEQTALAAGLALAWLRRFPDEEGHSYICLHLLIRSDLSGEVVTDALAIAAAYLEQPRSDEHYARVAQAVLRRRELSAAAANQLAGRLLGWLDGRSRNSRLTATLGLLARDDLEPHHELATVSAALEVLGEGPFNRTTGLTLDLLLDRRHDERWWPRIRELVTEWLTLFPDVPATPYVVRPLIGDSRLSDSYRARLVTMMIDWLPVYWMRNSCPQAIMAVIESGRPLGDHATALAQYSLAWLDTRQNRFEGTTGQSVRDLARELTTALLRVPEIDARSRAEIERWSEQTRR